jgi:hypothetical protein
MDDIYSDIGAQGFTTFVAILVSPLLPCFGLTLVWMIALSASHGVDPIFFVVVVFGGVFTLFTYAALLVIGVPTFFVLYALGVRGLWPYVTVGFLAGGLLPFFVGNPLWAWEQHIGPLCAAIGATTIWIAWSIRRPDLDPA